MFYSCYQCFARKDYCDSPCSSKECSNSPPYADKVLTVRDSTELRDPLAFVPKVILDAKSIHNGTVSLFTAENCLVILI